MISQVLIRVQVDEHHEAAQCCLYSMQNVFMILLCKMLAVLTMGYLLCRKEAVVQHDALSVLLPLLGLEDAETTSSSQPPAPTMQVATKTLANENANHWFSIF